MTPQTIDWDPDRQEAANKAAGEFIGAQPCAFGYGIASGSYVNDQINHKRAQICGLLENYRKKNPGLDQHHRVTVSVRRVPGYEDYTMITGRLNQGEEA